jgi:tRNA G10  N-methylase Trm11
LRPAEPADSPPLFTWHGKRCRLVRIYEEDQEFMRGRAPDMRTFWLQGADGEVRPVKGYRGSGSALTRRGLPVADARLLVNLVAPANVGVSPALSFLDPFGGAGGVVLEALASGYTVSSVDIDAALRPGLEGLGASHHVADAAELPFGDETFTAIATEPPYHPSTQGMLARAFGEMVRVLAPGGRLSLLVAASQVQHLLDTSGGYNLRLRLASAIDRKGTDVAVLAWEKKG